MFPWSCSCAADRSDVYEDSDGYSDGGSSVEDSCDHVARPGEKPDYRLVVARPNQRSCLGKPVEPVTALMLHNGGGSKLTQKAFYIGSSQKLQTSKKGVVGRFGEGLNLALAALWRAKCSVNIYSDGEEWSISEHDGQLWVENPEDEGAFPIGAVQYASHAMGAKEAVRELVSNWLDECTLRGEGGETQFQRKQSGTSLVWKLGGVGQLTWTSAIDPESSPDSGVVFLIRGLPMSAFDPTSFLRLAPPLKQEMLPSGHADGGCLLIGEHVGMIFVHNVRFDALTAPIPAGADEYATGNGFGYSIANRDVHVPRDRDAVAEKKLLPHLVSILLSTTCNSSDVQRRLYDLLYSYPTCLEARVLRFAMSKQKYSSELMKLGQSALMELRRRHGPAAFAVNQPLENMDLSSLKSAGLEVVDMTRAQTLGALLYTYGGHPDLGVSLANARDRAEGAAVDAQLDPSVRRCVDAAASELGRAAGAVVRVRAVDGPTHLVRRHVRLMSDGSWKATLHRELLEPRFIHERLGGACGARNRNGQCSCAFVGTVRELLMGAKESGVIDYGREQALLWNMLALGAGEGVSNVPGPELPKTEGIKTPHTDAGKKQRKPLESTEERKSRRERQQQLPTKDTSRFRKTQQAANSVVAMDTPKELPIRADDNDKPLGLRLVRERSLASRAWLGGTSTGDLYLEEGSAAARQWAEEHEDAIAQLAVVISAIVRACNIVGGGVQCYVAGGESDVLAFNQQGCIFVSARNFVDVALVGPDYNLTKAADRVFGWVKHELAHNEFVHHDLHFIAAVEDISSCLDPDWFHSDERAALEGDDAFETESND
eukprot:TRINITY_DN3289_c0_g3_i1.p1 TRINITY_DN3289_c0_g3~~TRINITY_DN3289_c0_g3_i1.p1  ORF type:complete len:827 (+),score=115.56 TRINITY_DN3289_c0_g3_i1:42-2522(+)